MLATTALLVGACGGNEKEEAAKYACDCVKDFAQMLRDVEEDPESMYEIADEFQSVQAETMSCLEEGQKKYKDKITKKELEEEMKKVCKEDAETLWNQ